MPMWEEICGRIESVLTESIGIGEFSGEGDLFSLRQTLDESEGLFISTLANNEYRIAGLTFSLAMVCMTSSGGVPSSSVMIENWLTSDKG